MARRHAEANDLKLYGDHEEYIGNRDGYSAPIVATSDGGALLVARRPVPNTYNEHPVVLKLDAKGRVEWERNLKRRGYVTSEAHSGLVTNGGYLITIADWVHPGRSSVQRYVQLEPNGKLRWEFRVRGKGHANTPLPLFLRETERNTYEIEGFIYKRGAPETPYNWSGEFNRKGRLIKDKTGGLMPQKQSPSTQQPSMFHLG